MVFLLTDSEEYRELNCPSTVYIGRANTNDFRPESQSVSKNHASITLVSIAGFNKIDAWLEDLDSRNGTYCGSSPLDMEKVIRKVKLYDGDYIRFGHSQRYFRYLLEIPAGDESKLPLEILVSPKVSSHTSDQVNQHPTISNFPCVNNFSSHANSRCTDRDVEPSAIMNKQQSLDTLQSNDCRSELFVKPRIGTSEFNMQDCRRSRGDRSKQLSPVNKESGAVKTMTISVSYPTESLSAQHPMSITIVPSGDLVTDPASLRDQIFRPDRHSEDGVPVPSSLPDNNSVSQSEGPLEIASGDAGLPALRNDVVRRERNRSVSPTDKREVRFGMGEQILSPNRVPVGRSSILDNVSARVMTPLSSGKARTKLNSMIQRYSDLKVVQVGAVRRIWPAALSFLPSSEVVGRFVDMLIGEASDTTFGNSRLAPMSTTKADKAISALPEGLGRFPDGVLAEILAENLRNEGENKSGRNLNSLVDDLNELLQQCLLGAKIDSLPDSSDGQASAGMDHVLQSVLSEVLQRAALKLSKFETSGVVVAMTTCHRNGTCSTQIPQYTSEAHSALRRLQAFVGGSFLAEEAQHLGAARFYEVVAMCVSAVLERLDACNVAVHAMTAQMNKDVCIQEGRGGTTLSAELEELRCMKKELELAPWLERIRLEESGALEKKMSR